MRKFVLVALLSSTIALATPAEATLYTVTFQGHVTAGAINQAAFGLAAGTNVVGMAYTATYMVNDALGSADWDTATSTEIAGGYQLAPFGNPPSPADGSFSLNGVTLAVPGLYLGDITKGYTAAPYAYYNAAVETLEDTTQGQLDLALYQGVALDASAIASIDFRDAGTFTAITPDPANAYLFNPSYLDATLLVDPNGDPVLGNPNLYTLRMLADSVTVAEVGAAVPEASSWAMLAIGFGAIGGTLRGRRTRATA